MTQPKIFITHRHCYDHDYRKLTRSLRQVFAFSDMSVHEHKFDDDDIPTDDLKDRIHQQIKLCNVFIAIGRRYVARAPWCQWEIDKAIQHGKLIATWSPYGHDQAEAPAVVRNYALHLGPFTQGRALATKLHQLGFTI